MASNLTREEARDRAGLITVASYQVGLDLTGADTEFSSVTEVRFSCSQAGAGAFLELTAPAVTKLTLNGEPVDLGAFDGDRISLTGLAADNVLHVAAQCAYSRNGEGLHRFADPADGGVYLYTDLETFDAHRVYACFDQPDLKATFEFTVIAHHGWKVISNAAPDVAADPAGPGVTRWHFPPTPVMSTYITAIAAGPYFEVTRQHDGIPLGIYCRQSLASYLDADEIFEITRQGFDYYHAAFGVRYPFGKYDQLFVPEYKSGAMENAGCVTFLEDYIFRSRVTDARREARAQTILHEMAHMWFGDLVTMRWWDDLWLNESFASWAEMVSSTEATRWTDGWTGFAQSYKAWAYRQDQLPSTHPVAADIPDIEAVEVNFDGITYAKGASVLKQLVAYVGRDNFLAGVRDYFARHAYGNATLADLLTSLERVCGRDLTAWSKSWLQTAGVNTLRPDFVLDADGRFAEFSVLQDAPAEHPELRPHRLAIGLYDRAASGQLTRRRLVELDIAGAATDVPALIGEPRPDLVLVNDDDLTYAKIRLDEHSLRTVIAGISDLSDQLAAALCWAAAWDMTRDGEMPARDFLALVQSGAPSIRQLTVLERTLGQAAVAVRRYADPAWQRDGLAQLEASLRTWLAEAEPGSDYQLAYVRALAGVTTSPAGLSFLAGLLDGTASVDGLAVDTELRWLLLHRLVSRGLAGEPSIDAELDRDRTDAGERHSAACRAAVPSAAAKAAAWSRITDGSLPNATFRAVLRGFRDPDQDELLAPYAAAYYDALAGLWQDGASDMAVFFAQVGYPDSDVSQAAIESADAYLASARPPAALRRLLLERRDDVVRALRCRQRDAQAAA
ncbi:MAG TPA: aminopeptidase N [Streptosporangiaceae bacterium]|nr:aminopeptidase N [Streptosporangiaceae bacterium]